MNTGRVCKACKGTTWVNYKKRIPCYDCIPAARGPPYRPMIEEEDPLKPNDSKHVHYWEQHPFDSDYLQCREPSCALVQHWLDD